VVFTLPPAIAEIAFQNKAVVYALLMWISAVTLQTIAANPIWLGTEIGVTAVLHTWGQARAPMRVQRLAEEVLPTQARQSGYFGMSADIN